MARFLLLLLLANFLFSGEVLTLSLAESEKIALSQNPNLQEVNHLVEEARYGHLISISDWLPKLELISYAFQSQHNQVGGSNNKSSFLTQLQLTQTIFSANKLYDLKITNLIQKELVWIQNGMMNDLLYEVRSAYYKVILDQNLVETALTHVEVLKALALQMERRLTIGTATSFDVNQVQVAVSNALSTYYKAVKQRKVDLDTLAKVLGFNPGEVQIKVDETSIPLETIPLLREKLAMQEEVFLKTPIDTGLIFPSTNPERQVEWISNLFTVNEIKSWEEKALTFRPDLLQAESQWKIAQKKVSKARGEYFPKVEFSAQYGGLPNPFVEYPRSSFENQEFQWGIGITLKWNIFDSFKRERTISSKKAAALAEKSNLYAKRHNAIKEVRDQIFSIEHAMATHSSSEGIYKLAKQALVQAEEKLEIGYLSIFDYQISLNNYIESMHIFFQSQYELIDSYYLLRHATGVDLKIEEEFYD